MDETTPATPLDAALERLHSTVNELPPKKQAMITEWIRKWSRYIHLEADFKPDYVPRYKRGDIVYVDFGFNIGNEYGGVHYAAVIEVSNHKTNGTIIVIPLTSLEAGKTKDDIPAVDLYLGDDVIPWTPYATVAKLTQIRAVSKMRIIKPLKKDDKHARLNDAHLDMIDNRLKQMIFQKPDISETDIPETSLQGPNDMV